MQMDTKSQKHHSSTNNNNSNSSSNMRSAATTTSQLSNSNPIHTRATTGSKDGKRALHEQVKSAELVNGQAQHVQSQPLQARSSNSGTSVKRSDNISQSSYPVGDVCSDKANLTAAAANASSAKAHNTGAAGGVTGIRQLAPGQLTSAFSQAQRKDASSNSTAMTKDGVMSSSTRRAHIHQNSITPTSNANVAAAVRRGTTPTAEAASATQSAGGVGTRASERRAGLRSAQGAGASHQQLPESVGVRAVKDGAVGQQTVGRVPAPATPQDKTSTILQPVKQANSELGGNMRTTRSKAKQAQQSENTAILSDRPPKGDDSCVISQISNGQSRDQHMQKEDEKVNQAPQKEFGGNSENIPTVSLNLKAVKRPEQEAGQAWPMEDSNQRSPRSISSTLNALAIEKAGNQSFQINESTDSLMENPLTTVIKQFQNLRTSAQLTGKNKPTIQQFLEKFEKEMQYLEDQYQAQQQAREEQMRLFEQLNGSKPLQHPNPDPNQKQGLPHLTQQVSFAQGSSVVEQQVACSIGTGQTPNAASSSQMNDTIMVQDPSTLGPMPHDQSNNSFLSAVHGPNHGNGSVFGGVSSELTSSEVYESFQFTQNSMLAFYPRQVRKILTRRKTVNNANTTITDLKELKPPKHRTKVAKNMAKMQGLAVCQMNMMQILLQKISRRSKVIRKQEKIVNDNLKRKRIYLEKDKFDLMSVLRKSLDAADAKGQQVQPSSMGVSAQKSKTKTSGSDFNSRCPSTAGTKSGIDQPTLTQSIKGSLATAAHHVFADGEITSMDGVAQYRQQTRFMSGAENCLSIPESEHHQQVALGRAQNQAPAKVSQTPEPPAGKFVGNTDEQLQRAAEQMNQAVHLSEIDDSFLNVDKKSQKSVNKLEHVSHHTMPNVTYGQVSESHLTQTLHNKHYTAQQNEDMMTMQAEPVTPDRVMTDVPAQIAVQSKYMYQSETPAYDYEQRRAGLGPLDSQVNEQSNTNQNSQRPGQQVRKMQSTQDRKGRRSKAGQGNLPGKSLMANLDDAAGSFAIADLENNNQGAQDGKVSLTVQTYKPEAETMGQSQGGRPAAKSRRKKSHKAESEAVASQQAAQSQEHHEPLQPQNFPKFQKATDNSAQQKGSNAPYKQGMDQEQHSGAENEENVNMVRENMEGVNAPNDQEPASHFMQHPFIGVDYYHHHGYPFIHDGIEMQNDHHYFNGADHRQTIFPDFMKGPQASAGSDEAPHHHHQMPNAQDTVHEQPLVSTDLAMHRSQSVMLPQTQLFNLEAPHHALIDQIVGGGHGHLPGFDLGQTPIAETPANGQSISNQTKANVQKNIMDPSFDASVEDLSSIEHPAANIDNFTSGAFQHNPHQHGFNPYEQAKRQALKKQQSAAAAAAQVASQQQQQQQSSQIQGSSTSGHLKVEQIHVPRGQELHFISPMANVSDAHTPQTKVQVGQMQGVQGTSHVVAGTPSRFIGAVEEGGSGELTKNSALGVQHHGQVVEGAHQQLSVGRFCTADPFNISGGGVFHQQRHPDSSAAPSVAQLGSNAQLSALRGVGAFMHTPAGLLSNIQQSITDNHRQHLSVSGWHIEDPAGAGHATQSHPNGGVAGHPQDIQVTNVDEQYSSRQHHQPGSSSYL